MLGLTSTEQKFLALLRAALNDGDACDVCDVCMENADWAAIFTLAGQQKLLPIVYEYAHKSPDAQKEENAALFGAVRQQALMQVLGQTVRTAEFSALYATLRAAGLYPMVVKGQLCSRLYPLPDHRISGDDDLLISDNEFFACHALLTQNGLVPTCPTDELAHADEVTYTKSGSPLRIELHRRLFGSPDGAAFDRLFAGVSLVEIDGSQETGRDDGEKGSYFLTFHPHEHLLYLILHAYKHFVGSGVGVRQICDVGLWAQTYHDAVDWPRLYAQCASVHAAGFAEAVFSAARETLGIAFDLPAPWGAATDAGPLLHDALCGGVYGSNDLTRLHSSTVTRDAARAGRGEKRQGGLVAALFPDRRYMERQYPYVKRSALLLPAAWAQRMVRYFKETRRRDDSSASGSLRLAQQRLELLRLYGALD